MTTTESDEPYDRYRRAVALLDAGSPDAAAVLLDRLHEEDPRSASVLEAFARALFDTRRFAEAAAAFEDLVERNPSEDYAHYGLGLSYWRLSRFAEARDHLAMAFVMRPGRSDYGDALAQVKATLRSREAAGLPREGPIGA